MKEITEKEYKQYQLLRKIFLHMNPEKFEGLYFISRESGEKYEMGHPENITVCPAYGVDSRLTKMYKRDWQEG